MASYPMFVSFYTQSHEVKAMRLKESLDRLGLKHDIISIMSGHEEDPEVDGLDAIWAMTCRRRSNFILRMMEKHGTVVWLDSDVVVLRPPELLAQISSRYHVGISNRPSGLLGGVIWAQPQSKFFWEMVMDQEDRDEDLRTQKALERCRLEGIPLHVYPLPASYQYVPWLMRLESALRPSDVFIVHEMHHSKTVHEDTWARWARGI